MSDEHTPAGADGETQRVEPSAEQPAPPSAASPWEASRGRRIGVRSLIVIATLIGILSVYATWARTQLLDTPQWKRTSTQLLEDKEIRTQISSYLVDQLYANVDVEKEIGDQLPKTLKALAPAAAAGLRQVVDQVADKALSRPIVQTSWANANEIAHRQLVKVVDGGGKNLSTTGGVVTLNLQPVLTQIASRLGIPDSLIQQIPPQAASVEILRSSELKQAQDGVKLLRTLAIVLAFVVVLLFTLAVWLAAGHRRQTLMAVGFGFITAGFVVLIIRGIAGREVTNSLVTTASVRPAVENAWAIGTSLLQTLGVQAMIIGLGIVISSVGRRAGAPGRRDSQGGRSGAARAPRGGVQPARRRPPAVPGVGTDPGGAAAPVHRLPDRLLVPRAVPAAPVDRTRVPGRLVG